MKAFIIYSFLFFIGLMPVSVIGQVEFGQTPNSLNIRVNAKPFAVYTFADKQIPRPYFHSIKTPQGSQVTRNHPPVEGQDLTDHAKYHPGLWMAFGDIKGCDFWRNQSPVEHVRFLTPPTSTGHRGTFTVLNHYKHENQIVCQEEVTFTIVPDSEGIFLFWDSVFFSNIHDFYFGDQEEMGLGIRMATPLIAERGGTILNRHGHRNEVEVWGVQAPWCAYYGTNPKDEPLGALLMAAPENFHPSWFHARDYGLLTANPFGRRAFTEQEASRVTVNPGERFSLRYGVYVFQGAEVSAEFFESKYQFYATEFLNQ